MKKKKLNKGMLRYILTNPDGLTVDELCDFAEISIDDFEALCESNEATEGVQKSCGVDSKTWSDVDYDNYVSRYENTNTNN